MEVIKKPEMTKNTRTPNVPMALLSTENGKFLVPMRCESRTNAIE